MDIKIENSNKTELFYNIQAGECFVVDYGLPSELICMKVYGAKDYEDNAVELLRGEILHFDDTEEVIRMFNTEITARLYE